MITGFLLNFTHIFFCVKDLCTHKLFLHCPSKGGLYPWPSFSSPSARSFAAYVSERVSLDQWHHRLGNPAPLVVRCILSRHNLLASSTTIQQVCSACQQGKLHRLHFGFSPSVSIEPLALLFLDVWGPAPTLSSNNKRYFLCVVDDHTKYLWMFPLSCKSDVSPIFRQFKLLVENFFSAPSKLCKPMVGVNFFPHENYLPPLVSFIAKLALSPIIKMEVLSGVFVKSSTLVLPYSLIPMSLFGIGMMLLILHVISSIISLRLPLALTPPLNFSFTNLSTTDC